MKIAPFLYTPLQKLKPPAFTGLSTFSPNSGVKEDCFIKSKDFFSLTFEEQMRVFRESFPLEADDGELSEEFQKLYRLKDLGLKIPVTQNKGRTTLGDDFSIYKIYSLADTEDINFELFKRLKISNIDILLNTKLPLDGLNEEEIEYIVQNKNRLFEISAYNDIDNNPSYSMMLAFSILLDELRSKNIGSNPILNLAQTEEQRRKLDGLLNTAVEKIRIYQGEKIFLGDYKSERIEDLNFFSDPINEYLKENKLIPEGYFLKFRKIYNPKNSKMAITYKMSIENDKKEKLFDDCALKVFKQHSSKKRFTEEEKAKIAEGESAGEIFGCEKYFMHGVFAEYRVAKYIEDCSKIPYEKRGTGKVLCANLASGYMISKFIEEDYSPLKENDFDELGIAWFDDKDANVVGGRIIDFGGIETDFENETFKNWIKDNIFEIEL